MIFGQSSVIDPSGRSECLRDDAFTDNGAEARWTCGTVDYDRAKIKMVGVKVRRRQGSCYATKTYTRRTRFRAPPRISTTTNSTTRRTPSAGRVPQRGVLPRQKYPLGPLAQASPDFAGLGATRLEYVTLSFGDAPPENKYINMNDRFLPDTPGGRVVPTFGANEDLDVRRIIPKNAALCGGAINHANCFMSGQAYVDESFTPTKLEKRWIFVIIEHTYFKMIRISVARRSRRSHARDGRGLHRPPRVDSDIDTSDSKAYDVARPILTQTIHAGCGLLRAPLHDRLERGRVRRRFDQIRHRLRDERLLKGSPVLAGYAATGT